MSDVDSAILKIAKLRLVTEYLEALGSTREQAETAAKAHADQFAYSGAVLTFKGEVAGTPAMESKVRGWFNENKLDFLIGTPTNSGGDVSASIAALAEQARNGNKTSEGKLFIALNRDPAKLAAVMSRKPFNAKDDEPLDEPTKQNGGKNPWGADWNVTEQGRILRSNPKLAASLAKSANSRIGATHPTRAA